MRNKGFSLVELLVVIGIIALIMVAVFPNFSGARLRARDNQRKIDLKNIQSAMELYKSDQSPPAYMPSPTWRPAICGACWSSDANCGSVAGSNIYMRKIPCDPASLTTPTPYIYSLNSSDNLKYTLSACLENPADSERDTSNVTGCETSYTVHEP